jgi:hypothetical protein
MRLINLVVIVFLCLFGTQVNAQQLWQESQFGMTLPQVRERFPNAISPTSPNTLYGGAIELLRIPEIEIVGHKFKSSFFFRNDKLVQVTVSLAEKTTSYGARLVFDSLIDSLRAKYGAELSNKNNSIGQDTSLEATWLSGRTNIILYYTVYDSLYSKSSPVLNLIYQVRLAAEADKL